MTDNHGRCPNCNADLNGGGIWKTFYDQAINGMHYKQNKPLAQPPTVAEAEALADESAALYGASRLHGEWGRQIGIYDYGKDRTVAWQCPDCRHEWPR